ncbi:hypothetical protein CCUS01_00649 [Colletotrichum cuscutae]|uniref:Uncharacterized protein n=1 Tax=Colletotrichum cuscutae TaxID=1209917 RepID=A0AAI9Y758_9PEZI|nr:hypothetical protein CCUS01_00649 [Colletotrichum cuscutae]
MAMAAYQLGWAAQAEVARDEGGSQCATSARQLTVWEQPQIPSPLFLPFLPATDTFTACSCPALRSKLRRWCSDATLTPSPQWGCATHSATSRNLAHWQPPTHCVVEGTTEFPSPSHLCTAIFYIPVDHASPQEIFEGGSRCVVCPGGKKNTKRVQQEAHHQYAPRSKRLTEQPTDRLALGTTGAVYYTAPWQWRRIEIEIALTSPAPVDMTDPTWPLAFGLLPYR